MAGVNTRIAKTVPKYAVSQLNQKVQLKMTIRPAVKIQAGRTAPPHAQSTKRLTSRTLAKRTGTPTNRRSRLTVATAAQRMPTKRNSRTQTKLHDGGSWDNHTFDL